MLKGVKRMRIKYEKNKKPVVENPQMYSKTHNCIIKTPNYNYHLLSLVVKNAFNKYTLLIKE